MGNENRRLKDHEQKLFLKHWVGNRECPLERLTAEREGFTNYIKVNKPSIDKPYKIIIGELPAAPLSNGSIEENALKDAALSLWHLQNLDEKSILERGSKYRQQMQRAGARLKKERIDAYVMSPMRMIERIRFRYEAECLDHGGHTVSEVFILGEGGASNSRFRHLIASQKRILISNKLGLKIDTATLKALEEVASSDEIERFLRWLKKHPTNKSLQKNGTVKADDAWNKGNLPVQFNFHGSSITSRWIDAGTVFSNIHLESKVNLLEGSILQISYEGIPSAMIMSLKGNKLKMLIEHPYLDADAIIDNVIDYRSHIVVKFRSRSKRIKIDQE